MQTKNFVKPEEKPENRAISSQDHLIQVIVESNA